MEHPTATQYLEHAMYENAADAFRPLQEWIEAGTAAQAALKIITWNVLHQGALQRHARNPHTRELFSSTLSSQQRRAAFLRILQGLVRSAQPDVICLQELDIQWLSVKDSPAATALLQDYLPIVHGSIALLLRRDMLEAGSTPAAFFAKINPQEMAGQKVMVENIPSTTPYVTHGILGATFQHRFHGTVAALSLHLSTLPIEGRPLREWPAEFFATTKPPSQRSTGDSEYKELVDLDLIPHTTANGKNFLELNNDRFIALGHHLRTFIETCIKPQNPVLIVAGGDHNLHTHTLKPVNNIVRPFILPPDVLPLTELAVPAQTMIKEKITLRNAKVIEWANSWHKQTLDTLYASTACHTTFTATTRAVSDGSPEGIDYIGTLRGKLHNAVVWPLIPQNTLVGVAHSQKDIHPVLPVWPGFYFPSDHLPLIGVVSP